MESYQFSFEKLEVWQLSRQLTADIYKQTQSFPSEEKFSLISQIRRAALSVAANISEGTTRTTAKDQAHFTTIAFSSLMELFNHLIIACDLGYMQEGEIKKYREFIRNLSVKLSNLKSSQLKRVGKIGLIWLMLFSPQVYQCLNPLQ